MKESSKTSIFLVVALFLTLFAYLLQPRSSTDAPDRMVGRVLFERFKDPLDIRALEIAKIDPSTGDVVRFQVASNQGSWVIPSHENYPSDAKEQMGDVASALIGLEVLSVASENSGGKRPGSKSAEESENDRTILSLHALYGVVDPTDPGIGTDGGSGIKITCTGAEDKELAQLIIGKTVEGSEGLRYIRIPKQHPVYTAKISVDKMSTRFEDWIEKNLLQIQSFDVQNVKINDYSVDIEQDTGAKTERGVFDLAYDDQLPAGQRWSLRSMKLNTGARELMDVPLAESEEVSEETLSGMIAALDDLKIVDVRRKPDFLAEPLRQSQTPGPEMLERNKENLEQLTIALARRGFYFAAERSRPNAKPEVALFSSNGEFSLGMKNGVRYILRFGSPSGMSSASGTNGDSDSSTEDSSIALNRFLFIMTEFDESLIEKPQLEDLPDVPEQGEESVIAEVRSLREAAERSNTRSQDQFETKCEQGRKISAELNRRFADWFYIISEDVYKKIHLGRDEIVQLKKEADVSRDIDLDPSYDFPDPAGDSEFPPQHHLDAPTLPGQEGMFQVPDLPDSEPSEGQKPEKSPAPEGGEPKKTDSLEEIITPENAPETAESLEPISNEETGKSAPEDSEPAEETLPQEEEGESAPENPTPQE